MNERIVNDPNLLFNTLSVLLSQKFLMKMTVIMRYELTFQQDGGTSSLYILAVRQYLNETFPVNELAGEHGPVERPARSPDSSQFDFVCGLFDTLKGTFQISKKNDILFKPVLKMTLK